ncbi:MAG: methylated-DNA--[protein]-cysteine S-methyltransferase [Actinoallomurus sp.]
MSSLEHDPLADGLAALAIDAPAGLLDRVAARWVRVDAPIGDVYVATTDHGVAYLRTGPREEDFAAAFRRRFGRPLLPAARPPADLLSALRTGRPGDLRLDLRGLSPFESDVLHAAMTIPRGEMRPYSWIAREIGRPRAVRAVGTALGHNPVPLLVPCHRVIRADGAIGQYVFGSPAKEVLLRAENVNVDEVRALASENIYFVGNDTTGIVCLPSCRDARSTPSAHRRGYRSVTRAIAAGYRPCERCRPATS